MKLYTHLNFGGNCEAAFRYYETHLGGKITMLMRVSDMPPGSPTPPGSPAPAGSPEAIIHARLNVAGYELIGNDVPAAYFQPIRSSYLYLSLDTSEDADRIYAALADGGKIGTPIGETFFATRFAQLRDRFGVLWTILHERPR